MARLKFRRLAAYRHVVEECLSVTPPKTSRAAILNEISRRCDQ